MSGWDDLFEHLEENPSCPDVVVSRGDVENVVVQLIVENEERQDTYISVDDLVHRRLGFQNVVTQQATWFGICTIREMRPCFISNLMCTQRGRQKIAAWISAGRVPNMNEEDRNQIIDRIGEPFSALFEPDPE
jgi:hypothetical protein